GVRGTLTDPAVGDGFLGAVQARVAVDLGQLVIGLEGAVFVRGLAPRHVDGGGDMAGTLALLLRQVRGGQDLAGELVGRADVDQVLGADGRDDLVTERTDGQVGCGRLVLGGRPVDRFGGQ